MPNGSSIIGPLSRRLIGHVWDYGVHWKEKMRPPYNNDVSFWKAKFEELRKLGDGGHGPTLNIL
jgi:hypothetical protein